MSDAKKQHYVPQFYLRQFVDPNTPAGQEPYVWIFGKNGKAKTRRAPKNILWETDIYTFLDATGTKHYELEKTLSKIESDFADTVQRKIKSHLPLSDQEHATVCMFVATMLQRTVRTRDSLEAFWDELVATVERLEKSQKVGSATSAKLRAGKKDIHKIGVVGVLSDIPQLLSRMSLAFLCADRANTTFITSDDPVTLFNPDLQWQRVYGPGLAQVGVQLTMPVSPLIAVCMTWSNLRGYIQLQKTRIDDLNRLTRGHCYESFISPTPKTKFVWFSPVPLYDMKFLMRFLRYFLAARVQALVARFK